MSNEINRQLYHLLGEFKMFSYFSVDKLTTRDATNLPFMIWPNGSPCLIGNLYMQSLLNRAGRGRQGLSRKGDKGGSIGDYAAKLGQLLRRCYRDGLDPIDLSDGKFSDFITEIRKEPSKINPSQPKKSESSVIATGKVWLDFLGFVGRLYGDDHFVSEGGTIRARRVQFSTLTRSGKRISRTSLTHHSFGQPHREHRRMPITKDQIERLKAAIRKDNAPAFVKVRRACLIDLLTCTGARRTELANLKVSDVFHALDMDNPLLRVETLKREDKAERHIPIFLTVLHKVRQYIEVERRKIMRKVYRGGVDHGFLFVSSRNGNPLKSSVISNEINHLRKVAGIKSQVTPHMFRHAFITNLFILLFRRHEMTNPDQFRKALLDSRTFLAEITSWTGQLEHQSIERYIHLAFRDLSKYTETVSSVHLVMAMDKYFADENELLSMLEEGMPIEEYKKQLLSLREMAQIDFTIAKDREPSLLNYNT